MVAWLLARGQRRAWPELGGPGAGHHLRLSWRFAGHAAEIARFPFRSWPELRGRLGLGDRTTVMRALFSPLLDDTVLCRVSKASFAGVHWGPATRRFAKDWDGTGSRPGTST